MQIQVSSDRNIKEHEAQAAQVSSVVGSALSRFSDHITRVEVHLSDENGDKKAGHDSMRCMMEARIEGRRPIAVTCHRVTGQTLIRPHLKRNSRRKDERYHGESAPKDQRSRGGVGTRATRGEIDPLSAGRQLEIEQDSRKRREQYDA